jgi:hypothetical protein
MTRQAPRAGTTSGLIDATADWLMTQALGDTGMEQLVEGCCQRLWAAGVPLGRAMIGYRTLHPLFTGVAHIWRRDAPLVTERHDQRQPEAAATFDSGPHGWILSTSSIIHSPDLSNACNSTRPLPLVVFKISAMIFPLNGF